MAAADASHPPGEATDTVLLLIDGLRASALGAYGQTAYATPAFDRLAADGTVASECYAPTPEAADTVRDVAERLRGLHASTLILSDARNARSDWAPAGGELIDFAAGDPADVAPTIAETDHARFWSAFAERVAPRLADTDRERPLLAIAHTRGLYGPWDAPVELQADLLGEDDPAVEACVDPPDACFDPPHSAEACDARFAAACRYAAMVRAIDACVAGLLDVIATAGDGRALRLVVAGLRGFPLGEHGRVGGVDSRLYAEQQHVPLIWTHPSEAKRFTRHAHLASAPEAIAAAALGTAPPAGDTLTLRSDDGARALLASDRALISPDGAADPDAVSLYVRPDDRWQQNDVASLEPATCEAMLSELARCDDSDPRAGESGVARFGASN